MEASFFRFPFFDVFDFFGFDFLVFSFFLLIVFGFLCKQKKKQKNEKETKAKKNRKNKMKRNASKLDERHGRSRHRPTKIFLATLKVAITIEVLFSITSCLRPLLLPPLPVGCGGGSFCLSTSCSHLLCSCAPRSPHPIQSIHDWVLLVPAISLLPLLASLSPWVNSRILSFNSDIIHRLVGSAAALVLGWCPTRVHL